MHKQNLPSFNEKKAVAVASMFLKLNGGTCDKYWLNKLMYYAERQSLVKSGQPIFFDKLYSAPYGPIVSSVNDGIDSSSYPFKNLWSKHLNLKGNDVILVEEADNSVLSPFEDRIIEEIYKKFKNYSFTRLKNFFHGLPEHKETNSREDISYEDVLAAEGLGQEYISEVMRELSYLSFFDNQISIGS
jgi:uncharacterized phage-associated protein